MNIYRVWYTFTKEKKTIEGNYVDVEEESENDAKEYLIQEHCLTDIYTNFYVHKVDLLQEDTSLLKRSLIDNIKHIEGVASSFMFEEQEIIIITKDSSLIHDVCKKLFSGKLKLKEDLIKSVYVTKR